MQLAKFSADPQDLAAMIDWGIVRGSDFRGSDRAPGKMDRYQAETLVHRCLPIRAVLGLACASDEVRSTVESLLRDASLTLSVIVRPYWFFL